MSEVTSQEWLQKNLLGDIVESGALYNKVGIVWIREATPGEKVVTEVDDGYETTNIAKAGDKVILNGTAIRETYIVDTETVAKRYVPVEPRETYECLPTGIVWQKYIPTGKCYALEVQHHNIVEIETSWGDTQPVKIGDMLCVAYPEIQNVYRIAKKEFAETYQKDESC